MTQSAVEGFANQVDKISVGLGKAIAWLTLIMVVTMTLIVVLRYGFNLGWIWLQETVLYMHGFVIMLAMSYTLVLDKHVRVDIFYRRWSVRKQNKINILGHVFFLIPTCLFILFMSWQYVAQSWSIFESSQEAGGLPILFVLKSLLVISPIILLLQAVAEIIKTVLNKETN